MPSVRKLEPQEIRAIENKDKGQRKLTEEEYDRILAEFGVGEYGEVVPEAGENRLTVRNRLKAAAKRKNVALAFLRTRGPDIRFKVEEPNGNGHAPARARAVRRERDVQEPTPVVPSLNVQPPKKRGGRPKKTT